MIREGWLDAAPGICAQEILSVSGEWKKILSVSGEWKKYEMPVAASYARLICPPYTLRVYPSMKRYVNYLEEETRPDQYILYHIQMGDWGCL